jgi:hypothetical protein
MLRSSILRTPHDNLQLELTLQLLQHWLSLLEMGRWYALAPHLWPLCCQAPHGTTSGFVHHSNAFFPFGLANRYRTRRLGSDGKTRSYRLLLNSFSGTQSMVKTRNARIGGACFVLAFLRIRPSFGFRTQLMFKQNSCAETFIRTVLYHGGDSPSFTNFAVMVLFYTHPLQDIGSKIKKMQFQFWE